MPQTAHIRIVNEVQPSASGDFTAGGSANLLTDVYLSNGTGASQSDRVAMDDRTLGTSASEDLDLQTMTATPDGSALALVELRSITFKASASNVDNIQIGPASSNGFTSLFAGASDRLKLAPGATLTLVAPKDASYAVGGTNKALSVSNDSSSSSASYTILAIGTSA